MTSEFINILVTFSGVLDDKLLLEVLFALTTSHNVPLFSMYIKMFLQIRYLLEALLAGENWAHVGFLTCVRAHVIEQTLYSFEELAATRLVARVVGHCL